MERGWRRCDYDEILQPSFCGLVMEGRFDCEIGIAKEMCHYGVPHRSTHWWQSKHLVSVCVTMQEAF
jgi:hypothetical protein